jgi:hypothetical protein
MSSSISRTVSSPKPATNKPVAVDGAEMQRKALLAGLQGLNPDTSSRSKTVSAVPTNVMRSNRASELTIKSATRGEPVNGREIPVATKLTLTAPDYAGNAVIKGKLQLPAGVRLIEGDPSNIVLKRRVTTDGRPFYEANLAFAIDPAAQGGQAGGGWSAVKNDRLGITFDSYPPGSEAKTVGPYPQGPLAFSNLPLVP